jgi:hypothetical protein
MDAPPADNLGLLLGGAVWDDYLPGLRRHRVEGERFNEVNLNKDGGGRRTLQFRYRPRSPLASSSPPTQLTGSATTCNHYALPL